MKRMKTLAAVAVATVLTALLGYLVKGFCLLYLALYAHDTITTLI